MHTAESISRALRGGLSETVTASHNDSHLALRETHHRIKNEMQIMLSLMRWRSRSATCGRERADCSACISQVTSLVQLHELLQAGRANDFLDLQGFLRSLCRLFAETVGLDSGISIQMELESICVAGDIAQSIGLIVNEALTNAVKHAFPEGRSGCIRLTLKQAAHGFGYLAIEDDGVGSRSRETNGSGLHLMRAVSASFGGRMSQPHSEDGFSLRCEFPLANVPHLKPLSDDHAPWPVRLGEFASLISLGITDDRIAQEFGVEPVKVSALRAYYGLGERGPFSR